MKIYFDEIEINQNAYMSISNNYSLFSDTFFLGSVTSKEYGVKINKDYITSQPKLITIRENDLISDILEIDSIKEKEDSCNYSLTDKMINFNFNYDASEIINGSESKSVTLLNILDDICKKANVLNGVSELENDIEVTWYDNEITAREYISYIAELQASYAYIDEMGRLQFSKQKKQSKRIIDFDLLGDYKIGEYHKISRVVYEMGAIKYEFGDESYNTLYIRSDNPFVINQSQIEYIYNNIVDFEFFSFETTKCPLYSDVKVGDIITFTDGSNNYPTIVQYNRIYNGGWTGSYKLNIKSTKQENTEHKGMEQRFKRLKIKVDRDLNEIKHEVEETKETVNGVEVLGTQLIENVNEFMLSVKKTGTNNLLKNSVMFAYNDGVPSDWEVSENGELSISSNTESITAGCVSGHSFTLKEKTVKQRVYVKADSEHEVDKVYYSFSTKIKKDVTGDCYVKIYNTNEEYKIELPVGQSSFYGSYEIKALLPTDNYYDIELYGSEDSNATFTDNMFSIGEYAITWSQASGEIMNTQVNINLDGVLVKSSIYQGDYTVMSPLEFAGYSNINGIITKVFSLNKDTTQVKKLKAEDEITMNPIKIVPITEGELQGWAFVPSTGGGNK